MCCNANCFKKYHFTLYNKVDRLELLITKKPLKSFQ